MRLQQEMHRVRRSLVEAHFLSAFEQQQLVALERWLRLLPEDQIQGSPGLLFARAWILQIHGQLTDIPRLLTAAEQLLATSGSSASESGRPAFQDPACADCDRLELSSVLYGQMQASLESARSALAWLPPGEGM